MVDKEGFDVVGCRGEVDHEVGFVFGLRKLLGKGAFSNAAGPLDHDGSGSIARFPIEEFFVGCTPEY